MLSIYEFWFREVNPKRKHCYWSSGPIDSWCKFEAKQITGAIFSSTTFHTSEDGHILRAGHPRYLFNKSTRSVPCQIHSDPRLTPKLNSQK